MQGKVAPAGLDLAALDTKKGADEGFRLHFRHPKTKKPLPIWMDLIGADSELYQEHMREFRNQIRERMKAEQRADYSEEENQAIGIELVAAAVRGWSENMVWDGTPMPFSIENARKLMDHFDWMWEQAHQVVRDRGNFLPGSTRSS